MRYYLLAFANFLAAVGGGAILSSAFGSLKGSLPDGPYVAFFVGITLGLVFQLLVPPRLSARTAPWFSVAVGPVSLALAWLFVTHSDRELLNGPAAYVFVIVLSVRFGLWFFSRALRAQTAGRKSQGVALIELGYFSGMVLGLVAQARWQYGMLPALLADALLQPLAGFIDIINADGREAPAGDAAEPARSAEVPAVVDVAPAERGWYWRLTAAVVCLTVGFQGVTFSIDHHDDSLGPYVMACFYGGVALSALFCMSFQLRFDWGEADGGAALHATIRSEREGAWPKASFGLITLAAAVSMVTAVSARASGPYISRLEFPLIAAAAFIYQILVLSLLDHIGRAGSFARFKEGIKLTYLILGIGTVLCILALNSSPQSHAARIAVTVACALISFYVVRRPVAARACEARLR